MGIIEDLVITLDSWENSVDFIVLQPKVSLSSYPLILGRPWLATSDAFIGCRLGKMIISSGTITKNLVLYPPTQPYVDLEHTIWPNLGEEEEENYSLQTLMTIEHTPSWMTRMKMSSLLT